MGVLIPLWGGRWGSKNFSRCAVKGEWEGIRGNQHHSGHAFVLIANCHQPDIYLNDNSALLISLSLTVFISVICCSSVLPVLLSVD